MRLNHAQLWEGVVAELSRGILEGELKPGSQLVEAELAAQFGVSRGPIRQALRELVRGGLIVDLPRRGAFVSSLTESDLEELYVARGAVEEAAARLAIVKARDEDVASLADLVTRVEQSYVEGPRFDANVLDIEFHRTVVRIAGSQRLLGMFEELASGTLLILRTALETNTHLAAIPPPSVHRRILEALVARNSERMDRAIAAHFRYMETRLFPGPGLPAAPPKARPRGRHHRSVQEPRFDSD